jgi:hypothetical protein
LTEKKDKDNEVLDIYFDQARVTTTVFGVNMTLGLAQPHPDEIDPSVRSVEPKVIARTRLAHAKVLAKLLRRNLKTYEESTNIEIEMPDEVYESLNLDKNDW